MRNVLPAVLAVLALGFVGACTDTAETERPEVIVRDTCVVEAGGQDLDRKVDVTILKVGTGTITVEGNPYSDPKTVIDMPLPDEVFRITVNETTYQMDSYYEGDPLLEVYVIGDPVILGLYKDKRALVARAVCPCVECGGATICGCNPGCNTMVGKRP